MPFLLEFFDFFWYFSQISEGLFGSGSLDKHYENFKFKLQFNTIKIAFINITEEQGYSVHTASTKGALFVGNMIDLKNLVNDDSTSPHRLHHRPLT